MSLVYRPEHPYANENGMVDAAVAGPKHRVFVHSTDVTNVISDTMDHTRHMCDGKYYDSKAMFRAVTKAHGCVEVGNETSTLMKPRKTVELDRRQRRDDIGRALHELRNR